MFNILYTNGFVINSIDGDNIDAESILSKCVDFNLNPLDNINLKYLGVNGPGFTNGFPNVTFDNRTPDAYLISKTIPIWKPVVKCGVSKKDFLYVLNTSARIYGSRSADVTTSSDFHNANENEICYFYNKRAATEFIKIIYAITRIESLSCDSLDGPPNYLKNYEYLDSFVKVGDPAIMMLPSNTDPSIPIMLDSEFSYGMRRGLNKIDSSQYFNIINTLASTDSDSVEIAKNILNNSDWEKSKFFIAMLRNRHESEQLPNEITKVLFPEKNYSIFDEPDIVIGDDEKKVLMYESTKLMLDEVRESANLTKAIKEFL